MTTRGAETSRGREDTRQRRMPSHGSKARWRRMKTKTRTPRNQIQETAFLVQIVLKVRFLVFDFGVYEADVQAVVTVPLLCCRKCIRVDGATYHAPCCPVMPAESRWGVPIGFTHAHPC
eukprot:3517477-Rhodomonas_salina.5